MILYLLKTEVSWYDAYDGFVIAAESEEQARNIAKKGSADEGPQAWEPVNAICEVIAEETKEPVGIVLGSFNAG